MYIGAALYQICARRLNCTAFNVLTTYYKYTIIMMMIKMMKMMMIDRDCIKEVSSTYTEVLKSAMHLDVWMTVVPGR